MSPFNTTIDLGLRFVVEPSGAHLTEAEARALSDLRPAGVMLRKRNFLTSEPYPVWLKAFSTLLADIRAAIGRPNIIVSIDHEGGAVHRFPPPITRFPYPATYGGSLEAVAAVSGAMAKELASLGINLSFSPVADIHSNPNNPVINERAYGTNPDAVTNAALTCAATLRAAGILPCAKHFPGHGDTGVDSHYTLPVLPHTQRELEQRELIPFKALIDHGIEAIMTAHLMVPALDAQAQATISGPILNGLLRQQLGFSGVTFADALGMKGIYDVVTSGQFCLKAHRAGLDIFLMVGDAVSIADALTLRDQLARDYEDNSLTEASLLESQDRILKLLSKLATHTPRELDQSELTQHAALASQLARNAPWSSFKFNPAGFE